MTAIIDEQLSADRIKHLEFIQSVIGRLGGNSFLIKGWSLTLAGILLAMAMDQQRWTIALVCLVPATAFWMLDGYLLYQERLFRLLYDDARRGDSPVELFSLNPRPYRYRGGWTRTTLSVSMLLCHGPVVVACTATAFIGAVTG